MDTFKKNVGLKDKSSSVFVFPEIQSYEMATGSVFLKISNKVWEINGESFPTENLN